LLKPAGKLFYLITKLQELGVSLLKRRKGTAGIRLVASG
jgi:hypothetical protein